MRSWSRAIHTVLWQFGGYFATSEATIARQLAISRLTRHEERHHWRLWYGGVPPIRLGKPGSIRSPRTRTCSLEIRCSSDLSIRDSERPNCRSDGFLDCMRFRRRDKTEQRPKTSVDAWACARRNRIPWLCFRPAALGFDENRRQSMESVRRGDRGCVVYRCSSRTPRCQLVADGVYNVPWSVVRVDQVFLGIDGAGRRVACNVQPHSVRNCRYSPSQNSQLLRAPCRSSWSGGSTCSKEGA